MGLIPWSPLAGGLLAGALEKRTEGRHTREGFDGIVDKHRASLQAYEELCRDLGEAPAVVGLAWLMHNPSVTAPIIGARSVEQLEGSLGALDIPMTPELWHEVAALSPQPPPATDRNEERSAFNYNTTLAKPAK